MTIDWNALAPCDDQRAVVDGDFAVRKAEPSHRRKRPDNLQEPDP